MLTRLVESVLHIFAIGSLGYLCCKRRIFNEKSAFVMNKFLMLVTMPALCIHFLPKNPIENFNLILLVGYLSGESF